MDLTTQTVPGEGYVTLRVSGELDMHTAATLRDAALEVVGAVKNRVGGGSSPWRAKPCTESPFSAGAYRRTQIRPSSPTASARMTPFTSGTVGLSVVMN